MYCTPIFPLWSLTAVGDRCTMVLIQTSVQRVKGAAARSYDLLFSPQEIKNGPRDGELDDLGRAAVEVGDHD